MTVGYELHEQPDLDSPVLIMGLDGWIDAGFAAANAASTLLAELRSFPIATFDSDELLDHRSRRPVMHLIDGVNPPDLAGHRTAGSGGRACNDLLLLVARPDTPGVVLRLVVRSRSSSAPAGGRARSVPAAIPHTRAALLSATATPELSTACRSAGNLEVPPGAGSIERSARWRLLPGLGPVAPLRLGHGLPAASLS